MLALGASAGTPRQKSGTSLIPLRVLLGNSQACPDTCTLYTLRCIPRTERIVPTLRLPIRDLIHHQWTESCSMGTGGSRCSETGRKGGEGKGAALAWDMGVSGCTLGKCSQSFSLWRNRTTQGSEVRQCRHGDGNRLDEREDAGELRAENPQTQNWRAKVIGTPQDNLACTQGP